jgi:hypothetical protein
VNGEKRFIREAREIACRYGLELLGPRGRNTHYRLRNRATGAMRPVSSTPSRHDAALRAVERDARRLANRSSS